MVSASSNLTFSLLLCVCQMQAKVLLVHLLRSYNFSLPEDYYLKAACNTVLLAPVDGLPCTVTLRQ